MAINSHLRRGWLLRMFFLIVLFSGFGLWCLYDGLVKYPAYEENFQLFLEQLTEKERTEQLQAMLENPGSGEQIEKRVNDTSYALKVETEEADIPKIVFSNLDEEKEHKVHSRRDGQELEYYVKSEWDIKTQFLMAAATFTIAAFTLIRLVMVATRKISADDEAVIVSNRRIPFSAVTKIDKRKWYRKSIAVVHFNSDGKAGKFKLDDWVFDGHCNILSEIETKMRPEAAVVEPTAHRKADEEEESEETAEKNEKSS